MGCSWCLSECIDGYVKYIGCNAPIEEVIQKILSNKQSQLQKWLRGKSCGMGRHLGLRKRTNPDETTMNLRHC